MKIILTKDNAGSSEKIKCGVQNKIPCLKFKWVHDSVKAGHALTLDDYEAVTNSCSTPERTFRNFPIVAVTIFVIHNSLDLIIFDFSVQPGNLNWSTISVIKQEGNQNNIIQETMMMSTMCTTNLESTMKTPMNNVTTATNNVTTTTNNLTTTTNNVTIAIGMKLKWNFKNNALLK